MKKIFPIFLILLFSFCSKKRESNLPQLIVSKKNNVIHVNSKEMIEIIFFESLMANIDNNSKSNIKKFKQDENTIFKRINLDTIIPKYNINVVVDTSYTFPAKRFEYKYIPFPKNIIVDGLINGKNPTHEQLKSAESEYFKYSDKKFKQRNDYVECYPLLILNKSKDTILTRFKYLQEAKDIDGKWKPIEYRYEFGGCGNPETYFYKLGSNNYIIFPIIKYYGKYKTKLRIKVSNKGNIYYSNEFSGYINRKQVDYSNLQNEFEISNPSYDFDELRSHFFLDN